jgi:hypothetical protein
MIGVNVYHDDWTGYLNLSCTLTVAHKLTIFSGLGDFHRLRHASFRSWSKISTTTVWRNALTSCTYGQMPSCRWCSERVGVKSEKVVAMKLGILSHRLRLKDNGSQYTFRSKFMHQGDRSRKELIWINWVMIIVSAVLSWFIGRPWHQPLISNECRDQS